MDMIVKVMSLKHGNIYVCLGTSFSDREWVLSNVTLLENNTLKIEMCGPCEEKIVKLYNLSPEWFIVTSRATTSPTCPPLPDRRKQDTLFALTQPPEFSIWFLTNSKYERNQWIEKILPIITLKPPTPPEPPPPYSEYDNLSSYFPWDTHPSSTMPALRPKEQNSFYIPRPNLPRSGFYSLERPVKKFPKPVEPTPVTREPVPPAEPLAMPVEPQSRDRFQCVNCFAIGCACVCNTLSICLQMCCNNFSIAL